MLSSMVFRLAVRDWPGSVRFVVRTGVILLVKNVLKPLAASPVNSVDVSVSISDFNASNCWVAVVIYVSIAFFAFSTSTDFSALVLPLDINNDPFRF